MSKIMPRLATDDAAVCYFGAKDRQPSNQPGAASTGDVREYPRSALAELVSGHLRSNGLRQIDFCRQVGFDQGLLSKILSSVVSTLNVETALKLSEGMNLPAAVVFEAIGKIEVHQTLIRIYGGVSAERTA
jgi:hypothetical protein